MNRHLLHCIAIAVLVLLSSAALAISYEKHDLGLLPGTSDSEAFGINNNGQIVGRSGSYAFVWDPATGMQSLGGGHAYAINEHGQAVGFSTGGACYWNGTDGRVSLGLGNSDFAYGINDLGQVVGDYQPESSTTRHAFLWEPAKGLTDLGVLPGHSNSTPMCINSIGQVVGYSYPTGSGMKAFIWNSGNGMTALAASGWNVVSAQSINDSGVVAGYAYSPDHKLRGFIMDSAGLRGLDVLDGGYVSMAYGVNNDGQVVGTSDTEINGKTHAIMWDSTGSINDLGFGRARAINDLGWIVGYSDGRATLWTPVPEPSSMSCLAAGVGGLVLALRRK